MRFLQSSISKHHPLLVAGHAVWLTFAPHDLCRQPGFTIFPSWKSNKPAVAGFLLPRQRLLR
jgi:hypothetical protein